MSRHDLRARAASRRIAAAEPRAPLTGRSVLLLLVVALVVYSLAVPVRNLVAQRASLAAQSAEVTALEQQVAALTLQRERLTDPAYVETLIRGRLHYVRPGETGYVVLSAGDAPSAAQVRAAQSGPWYQRMWRSIVAVDASVGAGVEIRTDAPR